MLYFWRVAWFAMKDQHLALPSNIPSLDIRFLSLEFYEFTKAEIIDILQHCFEIPFDITEEF